MAELSWPRCRNLSEAALPGRTASAANDEFAGFFRESLSVITDAQLIGFQKGDERILTFEPPPRLHRKQNLPPLYISISQTYKIITAAEGFKARTTSYFYAALLGNEGNRREVFNFHWHPSLTRKMRRPHLHVFPETPDEILDVHFVGARCCIEDFVYVLVRDLDVRARMSYEKWKAILHKNRAAFEASATWIYEPPVT